MASYLKHLTLTHEDPAVSHAPQFAGPRQLNIKTVASCPHSLESKVVRKRCAAEPVPEMEEGEGLRDDFDSPPSLKKLRVSADTRMPQERTLAAHLTSRDLRPKCVVPPSRQYDTDMLRTPLHCVGSLSDLSSIPEEVELSRQSSSSSSSCGSPTGGAPDVAGALSGQQDKHGPSSSSPHSAMPSVFLASSPAPPSPLPATPSLSSEAGQEDEPCSVWIAPELQSIHTNSEPLLPASIINEM